jgi:hypothetical protein
MAIKTFTDGEVLTGSDTNTYLANSGLVFVSQTTVGSGVASVTISNCFTSTYDSYRIISRGVVCSTEGSAAIQLTSSATPLTTGYYGALIFTNATVQTVINSNATSMLYIAAHGNTAGLSLDVDIIGPAKAEMTWVGNGSYMRFDFYGTFNGYSNSAVAYDGFKVFPQSGTLTGGTITVYGYRKQ